MEVERNALLTILLLIESNNHLSASREGLEERAINREKSIKILLDILDLNEEQLNILYYK